MKLSFVLISFFAILTSLFAAPINTPRGNEVITRHSEDSIAGRIDDDGFSIRGASPYQGELVPITEYSGDQQIPSRPGFRQRVKEAYRNSKASLKEKLDHQVKEVTETIYQHAKEDMKTFGKAMSESMKGAMKEWLRLQVDNLVQSFIVKMVAVGPDMR